MTTLSKSGAAALWIVLLATAGTGATFALACATPFVALAALAAEHLRRRDGLALLLVAWAASQVVGFGFLHYPQDARTLAWGAALGTAAVVAGLVAYAAIGALRTATVPVRLAGAYVAAFLGYKATLACWSLALGGMSTSLNPIYAGQQFAREGALLIGLLALYHLLVAVGVPRPRAGLAAA